MSLKTKTSIYDFSERDVVLSTKMKRIIFNRKFTAAKKNFRKKTRMTIYLIKTFPILFINNNY